MSHDIAALLAHDPLAEAEQITGQSYKRDPLTEAIGLVGHMQHTSRKRAALEEMGDSHYSTDLDTQLALAYAAGFETLWVLPFKGPQTHGRPDYDETYHILFSRERGALLTVESYAVTGRNNAKLYFNWKPNEAYRAQSSGWGVPAGMSGGYDAIDPTKEFSNDNSVWVGYLDAREAFKHKLSILDQNGTFVTPWVKQPFLWLLTYADTKCKFSKNGGGCQHWNLAQTTKDVTGTPDCYDYRALNEIRLALLPRFVQAAVRGR